MRTRCLKLFYFSPLNFAFLLPEQNTGNTDGHSLPFIFEET